MSSIRTVVVSLVGVVVATSVGACSSAPGELFATTDDAYSAASVSACLGKDARLGPGAACRYTTQCGPGMVCQANQGNGFKPTCTYEDPSAPSPQRGIGESCDERYVASKCAYGLSCGSNSATMQFEAAQGRVRPSTCQSACLDAPCSTNADCAAGGPSLFCARTSPTGGEYAVPFCTFKPGAAAPATPATPAPPPATPAPASPAGGGDACAFLNDATYCGQSTYFRGGDKNTLYTCRGHRIVASEPCAGGCQAYPDQRLDHCIACVQTYNGQTCSATVTTSCYERPECTAAKEYYDVWKDSCGVSYKTRVPSADVVCK